MIFTYKKTGDRHICQMQPCEDALEVFRIKNYSCIILSDGCSSSRFGFEAAQRITRRLADCLRFPSAYNLCTTSPWEFLGEYTAEGKEEDFAKIILKETESEVNCMLELYGCERNELCCTLMLTIIKYDPKTKDNTALILCIGDGFAASYNKKCRCASLITSGENIENDPCRTFFCTSADAAENVRVYRVNRFDSLLVSSDGLTHVVDTDSELNEFMTDTASILAPTDAQFGRSMNLLLASYMFRDIDRNLSDDCTFAYYTTDKRALKRLVKNNKYHWR